MRKRRRSQNLIQMRSTIRRRYNTNYYGNRKYISGRSAISRANPGSRTKYYYSTPSVPELNHVGHTISSSLVVDNKWHDMPMVNPQTGLNSVVFPQIPIGSGEGYKHGNKCTMKRITIKCFLNTDWYTYGDVIWFALVRNNSTDRGFPSKLDIWDPTGITPEFLQMRNTSFINKYNILKKWKWQWQSTQDDATYPVIGAINGWVPTMRYFEKTIKVNDVYDNTDATGSIPGNSGVSYSLWHCCSGLQDNWTTDPVYAFHAEVRVSYTDN